MYVFLHSLEARYSRDFVVYPARQLFQPKCVWFCAVPAPISLAARHSAERRAAEVSANPGDGSLVDAGDVTNPGAMTGMPKRPDIPFAEGLDVREALAYR